MITWEIAGKVKLGSEGVQCTVAAVFLNFYFWIVRKSSGSYTRWRITFCLLRLLIFFIIQAAKKALEEFYSTEHVIHLFSLKIIYGIVSSINNKELIYACVCMYVCTYVNMYIYISLCWWMSLPSSCHNEFVLILNYNGDKRQWCEENPAFQNEFTNS
jgi:hypothetical protein